MIASQEFCCCTSLAVPFSPFSPRGPRGPGTLESAIKKRVHLLKFTKLNYWDKRIRLPVSVRMVDTGPGGPGGPGGPVGPAEPGGPEGPGCPGTPSMP